MTRFIRIRPLALAAAAVLLSVAACGGTATPTGQPTPGGPGVPTAVATNPATQPPAAGGGAVCGLLTAAEVTSAYGFDVTVTAPTTDENYDNCLYASADGASSVIVGVSRTELAASMYDSYKNDSASAAVAGVGDEAVWWQDGWLLFKKGPLMVTVVASARAREDAPDGALEAATAVGKVIASRM